MRSKKVFHFTLYSLLVGFVFCLAGFNPVIAQVEKTQEVDHSYKPLIIKLNEDGSKYVRFIMWHQLWVTTNNLALENNKLQLSTSIRRSRFLAFAQVSPRFRQNF